MHMLLGFYEQSDSFALKEIPKAPMPYNLKCGPIVQSIIQTESSLNKCTAVAISTGSEAKLLLTSSRSVWY